MKFTTKAVDRYEWHRWFAWFPVSVLCWSKTGTLSVVMYHEYCWLHTVERQRVLGMFGDHCQYREVRSV